MVQGATWWPEEAWIIMVGGWLIMAIVDEGNGYWSVFGQGEQRWWTMTLIVDRWLRVVNDGWWWLLMVDMCLTNHGRWLIAGYQWKFATNMIYDDIDTCERRTAKEISWLADDVSRCLMNDAWRWSIDMILNSKSWTVRINTDDQWVVDSG